MKFFHLDWRRLRGIMNRYFLKRGKI